MTHITAIIRKINYMADDLGDMELQFRELASDVKILMETHIPNFRRDINTYELIRIGEQKTLGDFE